MMFHSAKAIAALMLALTVSACGSVETATRNLPLSPLVASADAPRSVTTRNYDVWAMNFTTKDGLQVSEGNGYYPFTDVVWRGDPIGDRKAQLGEIFTTALQRGMGEGTGGRPVAVEIELIRFHGVTERVLYSIGGNYHIVFAMTVRDARTGEVLEPARRIETNLASNGGDAVLRDQQMGQTQKVRVTEFLAVTLRDELTGPVTLAAR